MEKALGITPQGEKRDPSDPPFSFNAAVEVAKEWGSPSGKERSDAELDPITAMNRRHLSRMERPRSDAISPDGDAPKRRDRSPER